LFLLEKRKENQAGGYYKMNKRKHILYYIKVFTVSL